MWSQLIKPDNIDKEVFQNNIQDTFTTIPVITGDQILFKREMPSFIEEHKVALDKIYNKHFKDYDHITKKDFYIFAYANTRK
jgi:hypothetical protein